MTQFLKHGPRYQPNAPKPKAVWFDIDNTLVGNNSPDLPSERFLQAVKAASGSVQIGLATARPMQKAAHIIEATGMKGLSILSNGAQIYDGSSGKMVVEYTLPIEQTMAIAKTLQDLGIHHWVQDDGNDHFWQGKPAETSESLGTYVAAIDLWQPPTGSNERIVHNYVPVKPFVIVASDVSTDTIRKIADIVQDIASVTSMVAHEVHHDDGTVGYEVFVLDERANKRYALLDVMQRMGLERAQTMAVGDGPNDTVIVEEAGIGVAVGNAVEQTKQVATYIAPDCAADGAAIALEELIINS